MSTPGCSTCSQLGINYLSDNPEFIRAKSFNTNDKAYAYRIIFIFSTLRVERTYFTPNFVMARYEYVGNYKNPSRKLLYAPVFRSTPKASLAPDNMQLQIIYEFEYDNKIDPQATQVGLPLSPFFFGQEFSADFFEPIPENNITHVKFIGLTSTVFFNYRDYYISYEYKNNYPVKETHRTLRHNQDPTIPDVESFSSATYSYECKQ